jgi:hypothetical protein
MADIPPHADYPPAPWHSCGQLWCGLTTTTHRLRSPLPTLLGARTLAVLVVRYQGGTLRYDEFVLASFVHSGRHIGLWVYDIWVDSEASMRAGRQIWGLPKRMAEFAWAGNQVCIADTAGPLAALSLRPRARWGVTLPIRFGGFGHLDSTLLLANATARGRIRPASIDVIEWADRLPRLARMTTRFGLVATPLRMTLRAPRSLGLFQQFVQLRVAP